MSHRQQKSFIRFFFCLCACQLLTNLILPVQTLIDKMLEAKNVSCRFLALGDSHFNRQWWHLCLVPLSTKFSLEIFVLWN